LIYVKIKSGQSRTELQELAGWARFAPLIRRLVRQEWRTVRPRSAASALPRHIVMATESKDGAYCYGRIYRRFESF